MTHLESNLAFWLVLTENKISTTVKISIYFLSPITFKTYQSQYRSKYSIRFSQLFTKSKNFEFPASLWELEIADVHCNVYISLRQKIMQDIILMLSVLMKRKQSALLYRLRY